MIICVCNAVSEKRIREAVAGGTADFAALQTETGVSTCCGCCETEAHDILDDALDQPLPSRHYRAA